VVLVRFIGSLVLAGMLLGGCAKPPSQHEPFAQQVDPSTVTGSIAPLADIALPQDMPKRIFGNGSLSGRTLAVGSSADIVLRPGEVVLTFDDGPRAGKTDKVLATLADFNVRATFLMLGSAAQANPRLAQEVAEQGHTVGSHTFSHVDLGTISRQEALDEIAKGERAVAAALEAGGQTSSPFFRFPYLSQSGFLRTNLMQSGLVVLDVTIDSKDYYKDSPDLVAARTLQRLDAQGSGIILFHDIHQRTVDMLPTFLAELEQRGYSVVRLVPKDDGVFGRSIVTADAPPVNEAL
jgi:peptidoglycan/xylan/chitin deacetylase (PgdA/CDA1 family)